MKYIYRWAALGFSFALFVAWVAGYDFNHRGPAAFWSLVLVVALTLVGARIGLEIKDNKE